jgi:hypothetical protein
MPPTDHHAASGARLVACLACVLAAGSACSNTTTIEVFDHDLGLLAHWAFEEGTAGSTIADSSGFANNGKPSANPPTISTSTPPVHFQNRFSLSFNGVDQWIEVGNPILLNAGGPTTIAAWVKPLDTQPRGNIVAHGYRFNPNYDLALRLEAGSYIFTTWDTGGNHEVTFAVPDSDVGAWVHLCGVFDGAGYQLYRNGVVVDSNPDSAGPQPNVDAVWAIGGRAPQPGGTNGVENLIKAEIDDVRIYGRALSAAEVHALFRR